MIPGGEEFSFAHPWVLWLLLAVPFLAWLKGRRGGSAAITFSSTHLVEKLGSRRRSRAGAVLLGLQLAALALFIIALARPQLGRVTTRVQATGVDIMLVLDVSRSMLAEDFSIGNQRANRIDAVKLVTEQFIRQRPNDRIGIVAFAGKPYLVSPLTLDHDWLIRNLERLRIGLVEDGTAIGSAIAAGSNRLKDKEAKTKLIVLLTDGDNNAGNVQPLTAAEAAKSLGIRIYTVGAGSVGEAPFPMQNAFGRTVYRNVPVNFDEKTLQEIAALTDARYFRATDTSSLKAIFSEIDKLEKSKVEVEKTARFRDLFHWLVIPAAVLLLLEMILSNTLWRRLP
jgi:Ca-activated chloride channel family protein